MLLGASLLLLAGGSHACSTVHVPSPAGTVIARTMEFGGAGGEDANRSPDNSIPWRVAVPRRGALMGTELSVPCGMELPWRTKFGYVSVDSVMQVPVGRGPVV